MAFVFYVSVCLCAYVWVFFSFFNMRIIKPPSNPLPHLFGESCFFHHWANFMVNCLPCFLSCSLCKTQHGCQWKSGTVSNCRCGYYSSHWSTKDCSSSSTLYNPNRPPQTSHGVDRECGRLWANRKLHWVLLTWFLSGINITCSHCLSYHDSAPAVHGSWSWPKTSHCLLCAARDSRGRHLSVIKTKIWNYINYYM